jgi:hypothetical protein
MPCRTSAAVIPLVATNVLVEPLRRLPSGRPLASASARSSRPNNNGTCTRSGWSRGHSSALSPKSALPEGPGGPYLSERSEVPRIPDFRRLVICLRGAKHADKNARRSRGGLAGGDWSSGVRRGGLGKMNTGTGQGGNVAVGIFLAGLLVLIRSKKGSMGQTQTSTLPVHQATIMTPYNYCVRVETVGDLGDYGWHVVRTRAQQLADGRLYAVRHEVRTYRFDQQGPRATMTLFREDGSLASDSVVFVPRMA